MQKQRNIGWIHIQRVSIHSLVWKRRTKWKNFWKSSMLKRGLWNKKKKTKIQNLVTVPMRGMIRRVKQDTRRKRGQLSNKLRKKRFNLLLKFKKKSRNLLLLSLCLHWKRRVNLQMLFHNRLKVCWLILIHLQFQNLKCSQVLLKLMKHLPGQLLVFLNNLKCKPNLFKINHGRHFKLQQHLFNSLSFKPLCLFHNLFSNLCNNHFTLHNPKRLHLKCDLKHSNPQIRSLSWSLNRNKRWLRKHLNSCINSKCQWCIKCPWVTFLNRLQW